MRYQKRPERAEDTLREVLRSQALLSDGYSRLTVYTPATVRRYLALMTEGLEIIEAILKDVEGAENG